ncbi:flocculation protein FLO11-like isoform X2 [Syzygium oleosum]|uniref:flocculation protein FLO11-like isoform X2 n=1 Tax=Syzygium oleosum TaxID=219896 RepID=UPI0024BB8653|nr:flocculation protein FLO11-like isoform X2 [Syzygium oleosum]
MASSQVEIAAASSPFGCVLRDHSRRDGCNRDFRKNLKDLVRDHLHTCLPGDNASRNPIVANNSDTNNDSDNTDANDRNNRANLRPLCGSNGIDRDRDGQELSPPPLTLRQARGSDRWAPQQAGDMVSSTMEIPAPSPHSSSSSCVSNSQSQSESGNNNSGVGGGASSLVQMWEARLNRSTSINRSNNINISINIPNNNANHNSSSCSSNSYSSASSSSSRSPKSIASANVEDLSRVPDLELSDIMVASEDPSPPPSSSSSIADSAALGGGGGGGGGQKQKVRVADIIRRLTISDNDHDTNGNSGSPSVSEYMEAQRGFVPVLSSPRIRGRQAFADLLMLMERDRLRELDSLSERRAVSQFSHKGRIQSMLKLRFLQRGMADRDRQRLILGAFGGNSSPHNSSAIMHLRERFSTAMEHDLGDQNHPVEPRSSPRHPLSKNSGTANTQCRTSHHQEDNANTIEHSCALPIPSSAHSIEDLHDEASPTSNAISKHSCALPVPSSAHSIEDLHDEASPTSNAISKHSCALPVPSSAHSIEDLHDEASPTSNAISKHSCALPVPSSAHSIEDLHDEASPTSNAISEDDTSLGSSNSNLELEHPTEASRALREQASQALTVICEDNRRVENSNSNLEIQQTTAVFSPLHEVASPTSDVMAQATSSDARNGNNLELQQPTDALSSLHEEAAPPPSVISQGTSFEGCNRNNVQPQAATDTLSSLSVWYEDDITEEQDADNANEEEEWYRERGGTYDWFRDISRPRSYWEDRRQEWYREMLETNSVNEEIRQLIERGRVSSFLSSDFRERMDALMTSHFQRQTQPLGHQEEEQDDLSSQERMEQLMSSLLQGHEHPVGNQQGEEERNELGQQEEEQEEGNAPEDDEQEYIIEDEEDDDNDDEGEEIEEEDDDEEMEDDEEVEGQEEEEDDEERGSLIGHQYHEASDYFDHSTSSFHMPSQSLRSWSYNDNEMNDDHEQVASTSSEQPPPSHSYYEDPQQHSTCMDNLSMEMELIIDLRGQMRQLQREMSELRKSIKGCMEMQVTLQDSMKQEMSSAKSVDKVPRKGNCCVCYEKQVDSLLYRCGHMCACLKCAHEMQWSSGKCPICRAPIVDVVRAYTDS